MITLIPENFVLEPVTRHDITVASLAWGFTIGFGWLTTWTAMKQTRKMWKRHGRRTFSNPYVWMIWLEILVCLIFGVICFLYLMFIIPPSFAFYFTIVTMWALQVQFLLQIIVNRCNLLLTDKKRGNRLKIAVAVLITAVNISVYCIWIPARLEISARYIWINKWWDRCEKIIYLIVDGCLNLYFILTVKRNLVRHGLYKYQTLVRFNEFIVVFSLSMDVLIISTMSLSNTFVYMQFHPLAYIVKLNIEMSMADLIGKIARNRHAQETDISTTDTHIDSRTSRSTAADPRRGLGSSGEGSGFGTVSASRDYINELEELGIVRSATARWTSHPDLERGMSGELSTATGRQRTLSDIEPYNRGRFDAVGVEGGAGSGRRGVGGGVSDRGDLGASSTARTAESEKADSPGREYNRRSQLRNGYREADTPVPKPPKEVYRFGMYGIGLGRRRQRQPDHDPERKESMARKALGKYKIGGDGRETKEWKGVPLAKKHVRRADGSEREDEAMAPNTPTSSLDGGLEVKNPDSQGPVEKHGKGVDRTSGGKLGETSHASSSAMGLMRSGVWGASCGRFGRHSDSSCEGKEGHGAIERKSGKGR